MQDLRGHKNLKPDKSDTQKKDAGPNLMDSRGGAVSVTIAELELEIALLRSRPLALLCRTLKGKEQVMTVQECVTTGSVCVHVVADELDALLAAELGESKAYQK